MTMRYGFRSLLFTLLVLLLGGCAGMQTTEMKDISRDDLYDGALAADMLGVADALTAEEALRKGDNHWRRDDGDRALLYYIRALELDGKSVEAAMRIARVHERRNNTVFAERAWNEVLAIQPDNIAGLEGIGLLQLERRQYTAATVLLNKALAEYEAERARLQGNNTEENDKETPSDVVTSGQPATLPTMNIYKPWLAANGLGVMADLEGDYEKAIGYYRQALDLMPGQPLLLNNLGYSHAMAGQLPDAESWLRQALAIQASYGQARRNLALVLTRQDQPEEAVRILKVIMSYAQACNDVGYLMMLDNHGKQARRWFRQAIDASPTYYAEAWDNLAQLDDRVNGL